MQKLDTQQELFTITMEECGELIQCCSKAMRRWELFKNSDSEVSLKEEIGDVYTMIELLVEHDIITWDEICNRSKVKRSKLQRWSGLMADPPKSEQKEKNFPVTWRQALGDDLRPYNITYTHDMTGTGDYVTFPTLTPEEEKEWERMYQKQVEESQKRGKESI